MKYLKNCNLTINSYGYGLRSNGGGIVNVYSSNINSQTNNAILLNDAKEGIINIYSGKYTSYNSNGTIRHNSKGKINIYDTEGKVYIASYKGDQTSVWNNRAIYHTGTGEINIKGAVANKCGEEENTTGICIYNEFGRGIVIGYTDATTITGTVNIDGAYVVGSNIAISNFYGTFNICNGKISGNDYALSTGNGYIYIIKIV